jgi:hypothetical protein
MYIFINNLNIAAKKLLPKILFLVVYGVEGGRLNVGRRGGSSWWREFAKIHDGDGGVSGRWLDECVSKKVGDGIETYFWSDPWVCRRVFFACAV